RRARVPPTAGQDPGTRRGAHPAQTRAGAGRERGRGHADCRRALAGGPGGDRVCRGGGHLRPVGRPASQGASGRIRAGHRGKGVGRAGEAGGAPGGVGRLAESLAARPLLAHDVKEMQLALARLGPAEHRWVFSTHLAAYLLGAGSRDPRLEDLAREFLGMQLVPADQLLGTGRNARRAAECPPAEGAEFAGGRAQAILHLHPRLAAEMRNLGVDYLFHEIELPLAAVLAEMESDGVAIDVPYLRDMQEELRAQLTALEEEVAQVGGYQ